VEETEDLLFVSARHNFYSLPRRGLRIPRWSNLLPTSGEGGILRIATPPNKEMEQRKPAAARMARSSLLMSVFGRA
jgi:hypothetical protein